jgi:hypothetical protein
MCVLCCCRLSSVEAYDPREGRWTELPSLQVRYYLAAHPAAVRQCFSLWLSFAQPSAAHTTVDTCACCVIVGGKRRRAQAQGVDDQEQL